MRFSPTSSERYEELDQLTFGRHRVVWTAGDSGILLTSEADGEKLLHSISDYKVVLQSFLSPSSMSLIGQLLQTAVKS
jgi:hypothetical protein